MHQIIKRYRGLSFDFTILFFTYFYLIRSFYIFPFSDLFSSFIYFILVALYFIIPVFFFKKTFGIYLFSKSSLYIIRITQAYIVFSLCFIPYLYNSIVLKNPLTMNSVSLDLSSIDIEKLSPAEQTQWYFLPFFYSTGLWPKQISEEPVTYFLPYKKGPPKQFPAEVQLRLKASDTRITIEGPKTPHTISTKENLRKCFENISTHSNCFKLKKNLLKPYLEALNSITKNSISQKIEIKWFKVYNLKINESERPEGFYLKTQNNNWVAEKYVLINSKGTQQAVSLLQRNNDTQKFHSELLQKIIQSQRVHSDLLENKNLINFQLSKVQAKKLDHGFYSQDSLHEHLFILTQLISKISVDPTQFEAYFHLGGHTFLISEYIYNNLTRKPASIKPPTSLKLFQQEWASVSQKMIHSALKYSKDINPKDPRITQLEKLWINSQKKALSQ